MAYDFIGSAQPVWLRAVMVREGDDVVTRCCIVTGGEFFPIEVRVNIPGLIRQARALGIETAVQDQVGGFGSWLKKAVRKVTKSKIVKAVGHAVGKVLKNPIVQLANPAAAIAAHTLSKAAGGKGTIKGAAGRVVDLGTKVVTPVAAPAALGFVSGRAAAALGVGMRAVGVAKAGGAIASAAKLAQREVNLGRAAATAIAQKTIDPQKALPLVRRAAALRANVTKAGPALAKRVVQSAKVKTAFSDIIAKAKSGNADAILASNVLEKSAALIGKIQGLEQMSAGGVPGLLITARGQIVRSPRGRFLQSSARAAQQGTLYRGPKTPTLRGAFTVAGWESMTGVGASQSWGGEDDPGNEIDGPFTPISVPGGGFQLEDYSAVAGVLTP